MRADLKELVSGTSVRTSHDDVTVFKSVGIAFEDLVVARAAMAASRMTSADVVIVGGGAVGVSAAYHLAAAGAGRVMLLERADAVGTGSTGACAGGFRHQFSSRINIELSLASVPMIVGFSEEHGLPLDVAQDGYLFLVRTEADWDIVPGSGRAAALAGGRRAAADAGGGGRGRAGHRGRGSRRGDVLSGRRDRRPRRADTGIRDRGAPGRRRHRAQHGRNGRSRFEVDGLSASAPRTA